MGLPCKSELEVFAKEDAYLGKANTDVEPIVLLLNSHTNAPSSQPNMHSQAAAPLLEVKPDADLAHGNMGGATASGAIAPSGGVKSEGQQRSGGKLSAQRQAKQEPHLFVMALDAGHKNGTFRVGSAPLSRLERADFSYVYNRVRTWSVPPDHSNFDTGVHVVFEAGKPHFDFMVDRAEKKWMKEEDVLLASWKSVIGFENLEQVDSDILEHVQNSSQGRFKIKEDPQTKKIILEQNLPTDALERNQKPVTLLVDDVVRVVIHALLEKLMQQIELTTEIQPDREDIVKLVLTCPAHMPAHCKGRYIHLAREALRDFKRSTVFQTLIEKDEHDPIAEPRLEVFALEEQHGAVLAKLPTEFEDLCYGSCDEGIERVLVNDLGSTTLDVASISMHQEDGRVKIRSEFSTGYFFGGSQLTSMFRNDFKSFVNEKGWSWQEGQWRQLDAYLFNPYYMDEAKLAGLDATAKDPQPTRFNPFRSTNVDNKFQKRLSAEVRRLAGNTIKSVDIKVIKKSVDRYQDKLGSISRQAY